jgi:hypothetical protein
VEFRGQPGAAAPRVRRRLDGRHSWELGREIANTVSLEASQLVAGGQAPHAAASPELAPQTLLCTETVPGQAAHSSSTGLHFGTGPQESLD